MAYPPPLQPNYYSPRPGDAPPAGLAIASMVCGIVSIPLLCAWWLGVPVAIVAIVLGLVARGQARLGVAGGRGMATAGVVCGCVTVGLAVLFVVVIAGMIISSAGHFRKW